MGGVGGVGGPSQIGAGGPLVDPVKEVKDFINQIYAESKKGWDADRQKISDWIHRIEDIRDANPEIFEDIKVTDYPDCANASQLIDKLAWAGRDAAQVGINQNEIYRECNELYKALGG